MRSTSGRVSLLCVAIAFLAVPTYAQNFTRVSLNIPFRFVAGGVTFPAGPCLFERPAETAVNMMRIRAGALVVTVNISKLKYEGSLFDPKSSWLIFHRYHDQYFLAEIWINNVGVELAKSAQERELEASGTEMRAVKLKVKAS